MGKNKKQDDVCSLFVSCELCVEMEAQEGSSFMLSCSCFVSAAALPRIAAAAAASSCLLTAAWLATSGICSLEQLRVSEIIFNRAVGRVAANTCLRTLSWSRVGEVL